jgi:hypothetical protein
VPEEVFHTSRAANASTHAGTHASTHACTDFGAGFLPRDVPGPYLQLLGPAGIQLRCLDELASLRVQWMFCVRFITQPAVDACTGIVKLP